MPSPTAGPTRPCRSRLSYAAATLGVIVLGLASRRYPGLFPAFLGKFPGDALWALTVFLGWGMVLPAARTRNLVALALGTSAAIEFSQLYQAPWINAIRSTTPGHLVLGSTFSWLDLIAYAVGIAVGITVETLQKTNRGRHG